MESWLSSLPQIPYYQGSCEYENGLPDEDEDRNPVRNRTYPEQSQTVRFPRITTVQWQALRAFYRVTLNDGAAPFTAPWLSSLGYENHFCRFVSSPKADALGGGYWTVSIIIEIISSVPMDSSGVAYWPNESS